MKTLLKSKASQFVTPSRNLSGNEENWQFQSRKRTDSFIKGSSDHLLLVYVKRFVKFKGNVVQNGQ